MSSQESSEDTCNKRSLTSSFSTYEVSQLKKNNSTASKSSSNTQASSSKNQQAKKKQTKSYSNSENESEKENEKSNENDIEFEKIDEVVNENRKSWVWAEFKEYKVKMKNSSDVCLTNRVYCQQQGCKWNLSYTNSTKRMSQHLNKVHSLKEQNKKNANDSIPNPSSDEQVTFCNLLLMFIVTAGN